MSSRLLCAAAMSAVCLPIFATPVTATSIAPGESVAPAAVPAGTLASATQVISVSGYNRNNSVAYTDTVYADPNNPICSGCYDFVIQLNDNGGQNNDVVTTDVNSSDYHGNKYTLQVAYEDDGLFAPVSASEGAGASKITFAIPLFPGDMSDPMIIYTNAMDYTTGNLTITSGQLISDPTAYVPFGKANLTPEPSSLMLLATGALGFAGVVRRRFV